MGLYEYKPSEHEYLSKAFNEANWLLGVECKYYQPAEVVKDVVNDPDVELRDAVTINVIFDSSPKSALKSLNWYVHDDETVPLLAYVSSMLRDGTKIDVREHGILEVPYHMEVQGTQKFIVTKVQGDTVRPLTWICKLVPWFAPVDFIPETPEIDTALNSDDVETGFGYLKVTDL